MMLGVRGRLVLAVFFAISLVQAEKNFEAWGVKMLDRYVAVTGGQAAYNRIQNQITTFTVTLDGGQVVSHGTSFQTRAGDFRLIEVAGEKTKETGVNAGVAWTKTPESAELLETGEERARVLRDAFLLPQGRWRRFYTEAGMETGVKVNGFETGARIEGRPSYQVAATPFAGEFQRLFFDAESGLLVKQEVEEPEGYTVFLFEDYFDAGGGVRIPRRQVVKIKDVILHVTLDSVQFNQPIPASTFEPPAEITRLLKKKSVH
jgi:outer membrane lipoprotein-sorting protein